MANIKENGTIDKVDHGGRVAKAKASTVRLVHVVPPENGTSVLSKFNRNPRSSLVKIAQQKSSAKVFNVDVLRAASKFIKDAALEAQQARESDDFIILGNDLVRCVPVLEFAKRFEPGSYTFVDAESLAKSLDYIETVTQPK